MMFVDTLIKEAKQLSKDKGFLFIAFLQPIIFIVMFGSSFETGDVNHLNTIVLDEDLTEYSSYVVDAINRSEYYDIIPFSGTIEEARQMIVDEKARGVFRIEKGFGDNITSSKAGEVDVLVDSSVYLVYLSIMGARSEVIGDTLYNISENVFLELEEEVEDGENKFDEILNKFDEVENLSDELNSSFDGVLNDLDLDGMNEDINELEDALNSQENGASDIKSAVDQVTQLILGIEIVSGEEAKKQMAIDSLGNISNGLGLLVNSTSDISSEVEGMSETVSSSDESIDNLIDTFGKLNETFVYIKNKADTIEFGFDKLQKDFLVEPVNMNTEEMYGKTSYFDDLGSGILSLIVFFICVLAPALNVISEKESNTLYRLSTTPANTSMIFMGKFLLFLIFGFIEMAYTLFLAIFLYDLKIIGSIYEVLIVLTLLACASISIGLFVSSKVKTMQQALIIVPVLVIPSFLISNSFFPPDVMPAFMDYLSMITPMTFSNHALNSIMIRGYPLSFVWGDVLALLLFVIVPLILFIWNYRRIRY